MSPSTSARATSSAQYGFKVGLPHTTMNGLGEHLLLMQAGHFQWESISAGLGVPMSELQAPGGGAVYATYFYVEEDYPESKTLNLFGLDQELRFFNQIRHDRGIAIDGRTVFDIRENLGEKEKEEFESDPESLRGRFPYLHMCNAFVARDGGNQKLKMCAPRDVSFAGIGPLTVASQYSQVRSAVAQLSFDLLADFQPVRADHEFTYSINPDRDTNGAGLVYFANYICFLDMAERDALANSGNPVWTPETIDARYLIRRKLTYQGNVSLRDRLKIRTSLYSRGSKMIGVRSVIRRESDDGLIALSECVKSFPH